MFVLQNATRPFTGIPGLRIEPLEVATTRSPFDLSLFLRERDGKYIGYIEYSTDLFDRDRIERMAGHFQTLLGSHRRRSRPIHCHTADTYRSRTASIPRRVERHRRRLSQRQVHPSTVRRTGRTNTERHRPGVRRANKLTYRELNREANQLAHHLVSLGIGPEKLVGICVERSIEMVVGLLGILKAGGAYVPLDPAYPKERCASCWKIRRFRIAHAGESRRR